jgi:cytosine/adenosine deaminase-related metal-dependent hydrolase
VRASLAELLAEGVAAVGEIDSSGVSWRELERSSMAGRCYRELTGFHLATAAARALVRERWPQARSGPCAAGLSPHAPYSVSAALFAAAAARSRHLSIHCAEAAEEQDFLRRGRGPFADLLASLGRLPTGFRAPGVGAVRWLEQLGVMRPGTQLVHCQELERGDAARIAGAGASIVVCPGTIEYFGRRQPPVRSWLRAGIPVALGTDSRASNRGLSMRAELQVAARLWPELTPRQLLAMATTAGGRSLGRPRLGRLQVGDRADLLVLPSCGGFDATLAAFVQGAAVDHVVHAGRRLLPSAGRACRPDLGSVVEPSGRRA